MLRPVNKGPSVVMPKSRQTPRTLELSRTIELIRETLASRISKRNVSGRFQDYSAFSLALSNVSLSNSCLDAIAISGFASEIGCMRLVSSLQFDSDELNVLEIKMFEIIDCR